ncbi:hypothetical protein E0Z10_g2082 [Xylaria hypoxylon]|uniref:Uncharacterized protein n=1 Tax=Xylaria hypoxylon TaxID=37992 RepID=A0A4Z0Z522_9PEZI|nr:hypothetical protein E0Z10_g2082 [Xylaria hypoxylon]
MSDDIDIDSILDSVISRSAARKKVATEEAIRTQGKEKMARTVQRLVREAQANLRATLSAELGKIAGDTEKKLETYHILQEEVDDIEPSEHNLSAALEPDNRHDSPTGVLELMQHNMSLPSSPKQEIIQPMRPLADAADNSNKLGANIESDDDKDWLRDNDESDQNGIISQEASAVIQRYEAQPGDLGWGRSSEYAIKSTPRNSRWRSSRKIILDSDEEDEKQNSTPSSKSRKPTGDTRKSRHAVLSNIFPLDIRHRIAVDTLRHRYPQAFQLGLGSAVRAQST